MLIGVLSDTHGALPPEVETALQGVDRIIHAGDIGGAWILDHLEAIAPVVAVRGNMDSTPGAPAAVREMGGVPPLPCSTAPLTRPRPASWSSDRLRYVPVRP